MPWTFEDVDSHKKGLSPARKRMWVRIANTSLRRCVAKGKAHKSCAASAIRMANSRTG